MKRLALVVLAVAVLACSVAVAQDGTAGAPKAPQKVDYFKWFLTGGEWVGYVLMGLSVVSIAMIIQHFVQVRKTILLPDASRQVMDEMLQARQYRELMDFAKNDQSILGEILGRALAEAPNGYSAMEVTMEQALQERMVHLNAKPEILAILGNTGPLIGLYGTVLGIILAFSDIVAKGTIPDPGELAGSIGVALVATFWGLTVAIPSLVVYAIMKTRIEKIGTEALATGRQMLATFRRPAKPAGKPAGAEKAAAAAE